MKTISFFAAGAMILFFSFSATSQNRWEVQFRPGLNFATQEFSGVDVKTGFGFEATAAYNILPHLGLYGGWGWHEFRTENAFGTSNVDIEETGYTLGLQFQHPIANSDLSYIIQAGAIYNHLELENNDGDIVGDTGHGFGWHAGAGLDIKIGNDFSLRPTARYRSLSREIRIGDINREGTLSYFSIGVGLVKGF